MKTLVFGSDPEVAAAYKSGEELFVLPPAYFREKLGVKADLKDKKHPLFLKEGGISIVEDGVAFEFTIPPSTDWKELFSSIEEAKKLLHERIISPASEAGECLDEVVTLPTLNYEVNKWIAESDEFQQCLIFGCDRDFNAFEGGRPGHVVDARMHPFRYFGGHIHISGVPEFRDNILFAVQCMALGIGLAAVAYSDVPEYDRKRTYLYGIPGRYRPQEYSKEFKGIPGTDFGIEFRSCSNAWTRNIETAEKVFEWARFSVEELFLKGLGKKVLRNYGPEIIDVTNECDQRRAEEILEYMKSL